MALFSQYAVAAAQEAIEDAGLQDMTEEERENVVRLTQ
jgi:3-oxoacyl-(acyl-carrier-protein) synthase